MATYSLSSLSPDHSPEADAAAERAYLDVDPDVIAARDELQAIVARYQDVVALAMALGKVAPHETAPAAIAVMKAAVTAVEFIERAANQRDDAEATARARWRGHLALGLD